MQGTFLKITKFSLALAIMLTVSAADVHAAGKDDAKITWSVTNITIKGAPGDTIDIKLKAAMPKGWHTYSAKKIDGPYTTITADAAAPFKIGGAITATNVEVIKPGTDENPFDVAIEEIKDSGTFTIPVTISADAKPGEASGKIVIKTQVCSAGADGKCVPTKDSVPITITVTEKGAASK